MLNKPIDEMSLRHLFSSNYSTSILKIQYWGPIINHLGQIEPSPDCYIIDKRNEPYQIKKCEFKYIPRSKDDFRHNGNFDIAIIWDLPQGINRTAFLRQLSDQNNCLELIVLNDLNSFRRLPDYSIPEQVNFALIERMNGFLLAREPDVIFTSYLIAKKYPNNINSARLAELLGQKFQRIRNMSPQGRGNAIARFLQMNPPLIVHRYGIYYCWNNDFEPKAAINSMERLYREHFTLDIPSDDLLDRI
jgi:hypothetical protein